eukprot:g2565.t1
MSGEEYVYAYVHGFLNDKNCMIGNKLKTRLKPHGINLEILDAKGGRGYLDSSVTSGLDGVEAFYQKHKKPLRLIGFSMGGLISTLFASKYPDRVDRLVLLNPGFNLESNWSCIVSLTSRGSPAEVSMKKWKEEGALMMQGLQMSEPTSVGYTFYIDSLKYPAYPKVNMDVLLIAGTEDLAIPYKTQHNWKKQQLDPQRVKLIEIEINHHFLSDASWDIMIPAILDYIA